MSKKRVLVPLARDFEEIEAVTIVDVLRRAGVEVVTAGLEPGPARGAHGISLQTDAHLDDLAGAEFDMIALPGGMPGADHLKNDARIQELLRSMSTQERWTAAICAAPIAFGPAGIAKGRSVTCYPGFGDQVTGASCREERVVVDGKLITSRGPGTALEFALTLVERLLGPEPAAELEKAMLVRRSEPAHVVA